MYPELRTRGLGRSSAAVTGSGTRSHRHGTGISGFVTVPGWSVSAAVVSSAILRTQLPPALGTYQPRPAQTLWLRTSSQLQPLSQTFEQPGECPLRSTSICTRMVRPSPIITDARAPDRSTTCSTEGDSTSEMSREEEIWGAREPRLFIPGSCKCGFASCSKPGTVSFRLVCPQKPSVFAVRLREDSFLAVVLVV